MKEKFGKSSKVSKYYDHDCRVKDWAYTINLNDKVSKGTYCILVFIDRNTTMYFDTFGIKYISQDVLNKTKDKSITLIISRILFNNAISCGIYSITFIEYMIAGKTLD